MRGLIAFLTGLLVAANATAQTNILFPSGVDVSPDGSQITFDWQGDIWLAPISGGEAAPLTRNPSRDRSPRFSPDGKSLAFTSDRENGVQVFTLPLAGGSPSQVSHHTEGYLLNGWHPDGKSLLVQATRDHFWRHGQRFFLLNPSERTADQLLFDDYGQEGSLSPDGKRILFVREGPAWWRKGYQGSQAAQIWMHDRETGKYYPILRHARGCRSPLWKPDGKGFYYTGAQDGPFNLREYDLATGKDRRITNFTEDHVVMPALSRDGGTVVFRSLAHLYAIKPGKDETPRKIQLATRADYEPPKEERRTLSSATEVAFSPDGLEVAFIAGGDLWVMDTELREPRQVTNTPEEEKNPLWLNNSEGLLYIRDGGVAADIFRANRKNKEKFWWLNDSFDHQQITQDGEPKENLTLSPDGKSIAYSRLRGDLFISPISGENPRKILSSWNQLDYDWSPDGKWLVYAQYDTDFNRDIWILPIDLSKPAFNLSRHPDNESNPTWSPDGKVIAFTGRRSGGEEVDIYYVHLSQEEDETTSRDRKMQKAIEKINKTRVKSKSDGKAADDADKKTAPDKDKEKRLPPFAVKKEDPVEVKIDWNNLHKRLHRLSLPDSTETNLFWSPDGKKLAFTGTIKGDRATYAYDFPIEGAATPKQISPRTGTQARWLKNGNVVWLSGRLPASFTPGSATATSSPAPTPTPLPGLFRRGGTAPSTADSSPDPSGYRFQAKQKLILSERYAVAFDHCWAAMRDHFYDEKLGNSDWNQVREKYRPLAAQALGIESFTTVVHLMLGEINGSHLGFRPPFTDLGATAETSAKGWTETTRHPGVRFVQGHAGPGWKIRDVLPGSQADKAKSRLLPGEIILKVDDKALQPGMDPSLVLNGQAELPMKLLVQGLDGKEREVYLLATNQELIQSLLYRKWVENNQAMVEKLSQGKFGYLHISAMDMTSFTKFEEELYAQAAGRDGLVIDVRENGGGSTADHLLTSLTQPVHAIAVPRGSAKGGYPQDRKVYATWNKPIVVLCNQNSFSNAEIFSHAIIALRRGKVVGVPTAGGVISTGATQIMDLGTLRMPFRGWYGIQDGEDMELHGAQPHVVVWPEPGEMPRGIDKQLEKGVETLRLEVEAFQALPQPKLRKATDR